MRRRGRRLDIGRSCEKQRRECSAGYSRLAHHIDRELDELRERFGVGQRVLGDADRAQVRGARAQRPRPRVERHRCVARAVREPQRIGQRERELFLQQRPCGSSRPHRAVAGQEPVQVDVANLGDAQQVVLRGGAAPLGVGDRVLVHAQRRGERLLGVGAAHEAKALTQGLRSGHQTCVLYFRHRRCANVKIPLAAALAPILSSQSFDPSWASWSHQDSDANDPCATSKAPPRRTRPMGTPLRLRVVWQSHSRSIRGWSTPLARAGRKIFRRWVGGTVGRLGAVPLLIVPPAVEGWQFPLRAPLPARRFAKERSVTT